MREKYISYFALIVFLGLGIAQETLAEDPPEEIAQLMERGNVSFDFYDPLVRQMPFPGLAEFHINADYQFRSRVNIHRSNRETTQVSITVLFDELAIERTHTVFLPNHLQGDPCWDNQLMLHEFDHVAVSSDPRIDLIMEHLIRDISPLQLTVANDLEIEADWINDQINAAISLRTEAVIDSVKKNYVLLDEITSHGTQAIPDRQAFFEALYTMANFEYQVFPYTGDLIELLRSRAYRQLELPYSFDEEDP